MTRNTFPAAVFYSSAAAWRWPGSLCRCGLTIWRTWPAAMPIRRCACQSPTRSSWRSIKARYALRRSPSPSSRRFSVNITLDVEFVNFGNSTDVLLEAIATGKADAGVGMALRWLKALEQGFDVKLTAGTHGGCLNLLTAKDFAVRRPREPEGTNHRRHRHGRAG